MRGVSDVGGSETIVTARWQRNSSERLNSLQMKRYTEPKDPDTYAYKLNAVLGAAPMGMETHRSVRQGDIEVVRGSDKLDDLDLNCALADTFRAIQIPHDFFPNPLDRVNRI